MNIFKPISIGSIQMPNRFIRSATHENLGNEDGKITDALIQLYNRLAKNQVGLIISGHMYIHPLGRGRKLQPGIHNDDMLPGLSALTEAVHRDGGRIFFQLNHVGQQTTKKIIGETPRGPSNKIRDPRNFFKPKELTYDEISEIISAFRDAACRAVKAGADGIQIHAAHGYLINQFLSPFFNHRMDEWGGTDQKRFKFLKEVYSAIRQVVPSDYPIIVKLSTNDYTPKPGVSPKLSAVYASWLAELGIDGIEISCGNPSFSMFNLARGTVPVDDIVKHMGFFKKNIAKIVAKRWVGKFDLIEGYNLNAAKIIKPKIGNTPLILVGGLRKLKYMEEIIQNDYTDFISLSRPFIIEPNLIQNFKTGITNKVKCISCNRCLIATSSNLPLKCYRNGVP